MALAAGVTLGQYPRPAVHCDVGFIGTPSLSRYYPFYMTGRVIGGRQ